MNANELRIGNLVMINNETSWPKMKHIALKVIGVSICSNDIKNKMFPDSNGIIDLIEHRFDESINYAEIYIWCEDSQKKN